MEDNDAKQISVQSLEKVSLQPKSSTQACGKNETSPYQLLRLIHHESNIKVKLEKSLDRVSQLNEQGIFQIEAQDYAQALLYFNQCEKALEYAASCGESIDRSIILAVLNNKAVTYQRSQQHEKSASYVEAIIYNLNIFLDSQKGQPSFQYINQQNIIQEEGNTNHSLKNGLSNFLSILSRKYELGVYLLQFSGLQSQSQLHEDSLKNAKKALKTSIELASWSAKFLQKINKNDKQLYLIFKDLSELPIQLDIKKYDSLRRNLEQIIHDINVRKSLSKSQLMQYSIINNFTFQDIFSLKIKITQQYNLQFEQQFTYQNCLKKILLIICSYFTIGAQLQQLSLNNNNSCNSIYLYNQQKLIIQSEIYHIMALIIGYKFLPSHNKFIQYLLHIYRQNYHHKKSYINQQKSINNNLEKLTQKYKNYMIDKDISLSLQQQSYSNIKQDKDKEEYKKWNQQKKQSKKLNQLLKPQIILFSNQKNQQNYFLQVPSIDSIEMANSLSEKKQINLKIQSKEDIKKTKINSNSKLKSTKLNLQFDYRYQPSSFYPTPPDSNRNHPSQKSRSDQYTDNNKKNKNVSNNNSKKSKSTKKSKSKAKLIETKKIQKVLSHGTLNPIPVLGLMTTITERNDKKMKSKRSQQKNEQKWMIGSAGGQAKKWVNQTKKIISSDQIRSLKINQFSSVKNLTDPIKMNKVKGPSKIISSIPTNQLKYNPTVKFQNRNNFINNNNNQKNKSKNKNSNSFKSKKSISNNSKGKKSLGKTITEHRQKIYTSIKQTVKRK